MTQLDRRFVEYKRNKTQLLAYQDHYFIDIPERDFVKWERDKKKKLLRLLETCKAAFIRECEACNDWQSLITTFSGSNRPNGQPARTFPAVQLPICF